MKSIREKREADEEESGNDDEIEEDEDSESYQDADEVMDTDPSPISAPAVPTINPRHQMQPSNSLPLSLLPQPLSSAPDSNLVRSTSQPLTKLTSHPSSTPNSSTTNNIGSTPFQEPKSPPSPTSPGPSFPTLSTAASTQSTFKALRPSSGPATGASHAPAAPAPSAGLRELGSGSTLTTALPMDSLTASMSSLSFVPTNIRFGRGAKRGGFVGPHTHTHHPSGSGHIHDRTKKELTSNSVSDITPSTSKATEKETDSKRPPSPSMKRSVVERMDVVDDTSPIGSPSTTSFPAFGSVAAYAHASSSSYSSLTPTPAPVRDSILNPGDGEGKGEGEGEDALEEREEDDMNVDGSDGPVTTSTKNARNVPDTFAPGPGIISISALNPSTNGRGGGVRGGRGGPNANGGRGGRVLRGGYRVPIRGRGGHGGVVLPAAGAGGGGSGGDVSGRGGGAPGGGRANGRGRARGRARGLFQA